MKGTKRWFFVLLGVVLAVAGCGGDDSSDAGDVGGGGGDETATTFPTSVGDVPGVSSECEAVADLSLAISTVLSGQFGDISDDVVDALPSDARADGTLLVDALREFGDRIDAAGIDLSGGLGGLSAEEIEVYSDISGEVFDEDLDAAVERIGQVAAVECAPGS